jgi:hypothetical protein
MQILKNAIMLLPVVGMMLTACDDIKKEDRFIPVETVTPQRAVLLEDYTGQKCVNCPDAHEIIDVLKTQYGDKLIPVSIHAGSLSMSESETYAIDDQGLATSEGNAYANGWNIETYGYPQGIINRSSGVLDRKKWAAQIAEEVQKESPVEISLAATYNAETNSVDVTTKLEANKSLTGNLQLWLLENNITSMQLTPSGYNFEYVHNHVFRTSINGTSGEAVSLQAYQIVSNSSTVVVQKYWQPKNLTVVAFVYDNSGVLQAAETEVLTTANN